MGVFYPPEAVAALRTNSERLPWVTLTRASLLAAAGPWLDMTDRQLWDLMFSHTVTRSWMVWSNGHCPSCKKDVPMYTWEIRALEKPWKVTCPHCRDIFPKNDYHAFYRSGLNAAGVFDPARANRALLFNEEHPDQGDPLHLFGVDDGGGYLEGDNRWRFIGAYLVYGQWKQAVLGGIFRLSEAYLLTGNPATARKALILLDRVADGYPEFDFQKQALVYEQYNPTSDGYVSIWHDACEETRRMALAYDTVRDAAADPGLISFLSDQAKSCGLPNGKRSAVEIRQNIENRILGDAIRNAHKIKSNPPRTDLALIIMKAILNWPGNRDELLCDIDRMIATLTLVDGVTGEKGIPAYAAYVIQSSAAFLQRFEMMEPGFLNAMLKRHPALRQTWRFHIDTWCLQKYYPSCGDGGWFAGPVEQYRGVAFHRPKLAEGDPQLKGESIMEPSMFTFLWRLYEATGDISYVQALYRANSDAVENLPWDVFCTDPAAVKDGVAQVIKTHGSRIKAGNVDKKEWHIAIMRSGEGDAERAMWLDYDSGNRHAHMDGMNLGLFARKLDLMPDFGYPPVQYGGWGSPRSVWYMNTASHNTVVVDGKNQKGVQFGKEIRGNGGVVSLWLDRPSVKGLRASGANLYEHTSQYERTALMVDLSPDDFYILDVFRVVGGTDHAKFTHSHFGAIAVDGLNLVPAADYGFDTQMRAFQSDSSPAKGWSVDWRIEDRYGLLAEKKDIHFRYTDLSEDVEAAVCEAWVVADSFNSTRDAWIPRVMARRRATVAPLASTFVAVMEPYEGRSAIAAIRRLPLTTLDGRLCGDNQVAVEITLVDGRKDLFISIDVENPLQREPAGSPSTLFQKEWDITIRGELCLLRRNVDGVISLLAAGPGTGIKSGSCVLE